MAKLCFISNFLQCLMWFVIVNYSTVSGSYFSSSGSVIRTSSSRWSWRRTTSRYSNYDASTSGQCVDKNRRCARWARDGDCFVNYSFMSANCRKSCSFCVTPTVTAMFSSERQLRNSLLQYSYDKNVRPMYNSSDDVDVKLSFSLLHLLNVDEAKQTFTVQGHVKMMWRDTRLIWDPSSYAEILAVSMAADKIWTPGITVVNTAVADDQFLLRSNPTPVMIRSNGDVIWTPRVQISALCNVDVTYFPVDIQRCGIIFGPWLQDSASVNVSIWNLDDDGEDDNPPPFVPNRKWDVKTSIRFDEDYFNPCCSEPWPVVHIDFEIQRNAPLLSAVIATPIIYVTITILICFVLPIRSVLRFIFISGDCVILLLFLLHLSKITPEVSSSTPLIVQLTVALVAESILALMICVLLYHLSSPRTAAKLSEFQPAFFKRISDYIPKKPMKLSVANNNYNRLQEQQDLVDMFLGPNEEFIPTKNGEIVTQEETVANENGNGNGNVPDGKEKGHQVFDYPKLINRLFLIIFAIIFFIQAIIVLVL